MGNSEVTVRRDTGMPPKVRVGKDMILHKAFAMTRENGFDSITARSLADGLKCSTQPIFRVYENMEMLRQDLCREIQSYFVAQVTKTAKTVTEMGMSYVELAKQEENLFQLLCTTVMEEETGYCIFDGLPGMDNLHEKGKDELSAMIWIFTHGIAANVANHQIELSEEEVRELLVRAYKAFGNT